MTKFNREFDASGAKKVVDLPQNAWFRDLLKYWRPAGEAQGDLHDLGSEPQPKPAHLRLAVRDGYLNFYRGGQSVAKVTLLGNGKLEAKIHNKYVYGEEGTGQEYVKVADGKFTACDGSRVLYSGDLVHRWMEAAGEYAEGEKIFVDELVARNANVVDLEAGLPADPDLWDEKSAPRMDLVALEPCGNHCRLVFWEAKLVTNSEARCKRGVPDVIRQLQTYEKWLQKNRKTVCEAYRRACSALLQLHGIAKALYPDKADLGNAIVTVAGQDASELCFDSKPRLIIDDSSKDSAFTRNGHLKKLRDCGVHVHMVRNAPDMALAASA